MVEPRVASTSHFLRARGLLVAQMQAIWRGRGSRLRLKRKQASETVGDDEGSHSNA